MARNEWILKRGQTSTGSRAYVGKSKNHAQLILCVVGLEEIGVSNKHKKIKVRVTKTPHKRSIPITLDYSWSEGWFWGIGVCNCPSRLFYSETKAWLTNHFDYIQGVQTLHVSVRKVK